MSPKSAAPSRRPLIPLDAAQRYEIEEVAAYLRISRARVFAKIKAGEILALKDGRRTYIPGVEIIRASALPSARTS